MSSTIIATALILASNTFELPKGLLSAVCWVESSHNPSKVHKDDGGEDSVGLCQLHLTTAKHLGYKGDKKGLLNPKVNAYYAAKYMRHQLDRYLGDSWRAIAAYSAGTYKQNQHGITCNRKYVHKVFDAWMEKR